jgi:hypothetical protein
MAVKYRKVTHWQTFMGRCDAGPLACLCCGGPAKALSYANGEKYTTIICKVCGWYQMPTMNMPASTETEVVWVTYEEVTRRAAK